MRQETLHRRDKLQSILSKIDCAVETLDFVSGLEYESQCSWTDFLEEEEVEVPAEWLEEEFADANEDKVLNNL